MSETTADFRDIQREFTAHIRKPSEFAPPLGVEDRRIGIYRELFYNNVEGFMSNSFPVLRSLVPDPEWRALVRCYFADHKASTPLFPKLPQEFLLFLDTGGADALALPFITELAHYEWLEVEVSLDKREISDVDVDPQENCIDGIPQMNPVARVHAYAYPVHRISPTFQPREPTAEPTYLVVYRDRADEVGFMALNPVTARLIDLVSQGLNETGRSLLARVAAEMQHPNPDVVVAGGIEIMRELCDSDVLVGACAIA